MELIPDRAAYRPGDRVRIEVVGEHGDADVEVWSGMEPLDKRPLASGAVSIDLGELAPGGYGIEVRSRDRMLASTAVDVLEHPVRRPRYGFVARMDEGVDAAAVARLFRRLHLDLAQFYDWGYRHSRLLPPERRYLDPLGQPRDLDVVDGLADALRDAGVVPLGYSAVYAVGHDEADEWRSSLLLRSDGEPYRLGEDFLVLLDPGDPRWLEHYTAELRRALAGTRLVGFHLDQYGWPKFARRGDGAVVDLARSFPAMLAAVRAAVPDAVLVFNNVNDFGTASTVPSSQDASYIEVWPPHDRLGDLGILASRTRALAPDRPPILSAYLSCYGTDAIERADQAARFVMATLFSHGATHLLLGEDGAVLTDPYYPQNHRLPSESVAQFALWYDFLVRWGDVLLDPGALDVTEFMTGGINADIVAEAEGVVFSTRAEPGVVWIRVVRTSTALVVHLIDLRDQVETLWDAGKAPTRLLDGVRIRATPVAEPVSAALASPESEGGHPFRLSGTAAAEGEASGSLTAGQTYARYDLPAFRDWGMLILPLPSATDDQESRNASRG